MGNYSILLVAAQAHTTPSAIGLDPTGWVALSMIAVFGVMLWMKVPAMIGAALDKQIAAIRDQLAAATKLRADAEALRCEYEAKLKASAGEADALRARAEVEAATIVAKAKNDVKTLIARRQKTAEERIAAAERAAIADVRDTAARVAIGAARTLIADNHGAANDIALIDRAIADIAQL